MDDARTWRLEDGAATWRFRPVFSADGASSHPLASTRAQKQWLRGLLTRLPALLGDLGTPRAIEISTESAGEDTFHSALQEPRDVARMQRFVDAADDIHDVRVDVILKVVSAANEPFEIDDGAEIVVVFKRNANGSIDLSRRDPVSFRLSLGADVHAPLSWGASRDNRVVASLNEPRLRGALERIVHEIPAELMDIDAPDYPGMVGAYGFLTPEPWPLAR